MHIVDPVTDQIINAMKKAFADACPKHATDEQIAAAHLNVLEWMSSCIACAYGISRAKLHSAVNRGEANGRRMRTAMPGGES